MSHPEPDAAWPAEMDAAERVRHVALTRTIPRNAGWIASEATVSRDTAAKYLSRMVDRGELEAVERAEGTCYRPDQVTQFLDQVRELAEEHTTAELTTELREIGDEIDEWKREYEVDSLAELRQSVGDDERSAEERSERLEAVEEWAYDVELREAIRMAIDLQDSLTTLGDGADHSPGGLPQEG